MAIQSSFNLNNALNSQAYAYKCWYNYNYGNNTMGISAKDMGEITQTWKGELNNWQATATDDENAYEIEDDDFSSAKSQGKQQAIDKTGCDGKKGGMVANGVVDAAASGAVMLGATVGREAAGNVATGVAKKVGAGAAAKKTGTKKLGDIATVILASVVAAKYMASKPNKDQKEACDALQDEMINAQGALTEAQSDMENYGDELTELSDEAQANNEDANGEIEDKKSEYDLYRASYEALMEKLNSGEPLTDEEKELMKELVPLMQELGLDIGEIQDNTTDATDDIYDEMGNYQDGYDNAAETIGEVEGLTDYAESFDSATQTMCYVESGAQLLNAAGAGIAAAKLTAKGFWNWAFAAIGYAAAATSGIAATQQMSWAGQVGNEISQRKDTQDLGLATNDVYDESVADYEGWMTGVEDLELAMPKDLEDMDEVSEELEAGAEAALNSGNADNTGSATSGTGQANAGTFGSNVGGASSSSSGSSAVTGAQQDEIDKKLK